ncbi:MAG: Regulatory protein RecX [Lachnoclostridium sp.]
MVVTNIEKSVKGKFKIYIDKEYHFWLYEKELSLYHLEENTEIGSEVYKELYNTVLKRAKKKAMDLLKFMDRTERELIIKLKQQDYNESIISDVMAYIKSFHYIDDERYAQNYISLKKDTKSKRQIYAELAQKGIDEKLIEQVLNEEYASEDYAIQKAIRKKVNDVNALSKEEKEKLAASLYRKGFETELIKKYLF